MTSLAGTLARPLTARQRAGIQRDVRTWLDWQRDFQRWQAPSIVIDATPFVSLYCKGRVVGCYGSDDPHPRHRLARAFLQALTDTRFTSTSNRDRDSLVAEVSYLKKVEWVSRDRVADEFEAGTHGVGVVHEGGHPVFLLPAVARDNALDAHGMLRSLELKARVTGPDSAYFLFETESVVVTRDGVGSTASDDASKWLASLVDRTGRVRFAADPVTGKSTTRGTLLHARSAVVVEALATDAAHGDEVIRARRWLAREIRKALTGKTVPDWPDHPAKVAGTLALACRSGVDVRAALRCFAAGAASVPWHAAQVVSVLGLEAPEELWRVCQDDLSKRPWAPWTALAAAARGELATLRRCTEALIDSVRERGPYEGAVTLNTAPELALTALTVEALRVCPRSTASSRAMARALRFLERWQWRRDNRPAAYMPGACEGAYPCAPTSRILRCDVTAHAVLARVATQ